MNDKSIDRSTRPQSRHRTSRARYIWTTIFIAKSLSPAIISRIADPELIDEIIDGHNRTRRIEA
jgi:hypothetical protein